MGLSWYVSQPDEFQKFCVWPNDLSRAPAMLVDPLHCNPSLFVAAASEEEEEEEEQGAEFLLLLFQFLWSICPQWAIINHKRGITQIGLQAQIRGKYKNLRILLYFGDLLLGTYLLCVCKHWQSQGGTQKITTFLKKSGNFGCFFFTKKNSFGWMSHTSFSLGHQVFNTRGNTSELVFCICLHPISTMVSILVPRTHTKLVMTWGNTNLPW